MDERTIKRAAFEAVSDLELDCEIKEVCRSPNGDEWCVQFSGSYSQFCDEFQDQFEQDNSAQVVREKIKRHLIKQVDKIRRSKGKARRPKNVEGAGQQADSSIISSPLGVIGDMIGRATGLAGDVIERATGVASAAGQTLSSAADGISPLSLEVKSSPGVKEERPRAPRTRTTVKKSHVTTGKRAKKTKPGKPAAKAGKRAKRAAAKKRGRKAK